MTTIHLALPTSPTGWLAMIGLSQATRSDGAWSGPDGEPWATSTGPLCYRHDGPIPSLDDISQELPVEIGPGSPWMSHRGRGTTDATIRDIATLLAAGSTDIDVRAELERPTWTTDTIAGWMIDAHYRPQEPDDPRQRPVVRYALALIGAAAVIAHGQAHWDGRFAVGHLWDRHWTNYPDPLQPSLMIVWERAYRPGDKFHAPLVAVVEPIRQFEPVVVDFAAQVRRGLSAYRIDRLTDEIMSIDEVAEMFCVSSSSIRTALSKPAAYRPLADVLPRPARKIGRAPIWLRPDVELAVAAWRAPSATVAAQVSTEAQLDGVGLDVQRTAIT